MSKNTKEEEQNVSRRKFVANVVKATAGIAVAASVFSIDSAQAQKTQSDDTLPPSLSSQIPQDELIFRMQRELQSALEKPLSERKWAMVIDQRKCVGCHSCTVACKAENKLPLGVVYRPVIEEEHGTFPYVSLKILARPCMHCSNAPCTKVCPVGATFTREDGIVAIDYQKCIGCRYCISACPYDARTFDWGEFYTEDTPELQKYETEPMFEYGNNTPRLKNKSPMNNTRKCHFCLHRVKEGMLPACVTTCMGRATYFGDMNDPMSLVSELIGNHRAWQLKEELGTQPKVYYLA